MEKIYKSEIHGYFVCAENMHIRTHYYAYKEGDRIYVKHKELENFLLWKVKFNGICDKEGNTFENVEDALLYIQESIFDSKTSDSIKKETIAYDQRIKDGQEMSKNLMAELRVTSKQMNLPRVVNKTIEDKLDKVKINIDRGWWVTALEELELVIVEGYFTQELYDRIYETINSYILLNYD